MRVAAANAINLMIAIACFNAIGVARTVSSCIMMGGAWVSLTSTDPAIGDDTGCPG